MGNFQDSYLSGSNIEFIEGLYARFLEDPASVDPSWRELFARQGRSGMPITVRGPEKTTNGNGHAAAVQLAATPAAPVIHEAVSAQGMGLQARVDQTIYAFRLRGHLLAQLDPLARPRPPLEHGADLAMANENHFTAGELEQYVDPNEVFPEKRVRLKDLLTRLRRTYCGHVGVEFMTLLDSDRRRWLMARMEHSENRIDPSAAEQRHILTKLAWAEGFESFLHTKYVNVKRFSLDGGESLIPMLDTFLEVGGPLGMREVVIGMAHRGRLNVLTNILGKATDQIFSEFEGPTDPKSFFYRGDVKYHQGFSSDHTTRAGQKIHLSLAFNPSHLEAVDPVVEGRVRAKQDRFKDVERTGVVPVLIHGDASMIGQGVVAETLNLSRLKGYETGGTVHIVINNQIGYTTEPSDARSSIYCTAIAQMLDVPIFHVNGDDPEACVHVMQLATEYRQKFKSDVVIDLVCFRRYGHNEGDEPGFTQPEMYKLIRAHATVPQLYGQDLVRRSRLSAEDVKQISDSVAAQLQQSLARVKQQSQFKEPSAMEGLWKGFQGGSQKGAPDPVTGVPADKLAPLLKKITTLPEGFKPHATVDRTIISKWRDMGEGKLNLTWGAGETLAYATLLTEGHPIRLTGQDTERGTFAHRNAVLHDVETGATWIPLQHLSDNQGELRIYNSPLSEMACVGFEYGYSLDTPDALVLWEAQFGDFANGAQIIIDQFLVASERKWNRLSGLTLLLPHGYEGGGPEHSSARLERFLELCGDDNIQVCYPTNSAQIFHLLRRQVIRPMRKPLVVMTPKSLLRLESAGAPLSAFTEGKFQKVIADPVEDPKAVTRLLLCTGKVYFDLAAERAERKDTSVRIVRVEQLYPFPEEQLAQILAEHPKLTEIYWVQEEPKNMGAWRFVFPLLHDMASSRAKTATLGFVGRAEAASPATGHTKAHVLEQKMIVEQALARGSKNGR